MALHSTRRRFLAASAATVAAGLAGCSATGADGSTRLDSVTVVNRDATAHTVHVLVERGDDLVHWSSKSLTSGENGEDTATLEQTWEDTTGEYVIYVRLDEEKTWRRLDLNAAGEADCYVVKVFVESGDGGNAKASLWYSTECSSEDS